MSQIVCRVVRRSIVLMLVTCFASPGSGSVIYVRADASGANNGTSWADAYRDLQPALVFSQAGDEIRVAQGTYKPAPAGSRTISFVLRPAVSLLGGFAGSGADPDARDPVLYVTILSGDISGANTNNSSHVVMATDVGALTVLDGFTITAGRANAVAPNDAGAGLYLLNSSAIIRSCVIVGNVAGYANATNVFGRGGGAYIQGGAPLVLNCRIEQNSSRRLGGGLVLYNSSAELRDCVVSENSAGNTQGLIVGAGGGIYCENGSPVVVNCDIEANSAVGGGGGVLLRTCAGAIRGGRIFGNLGGNQESGGIALVSNGGGIAIDGASNVAITDCQILGNQHRYRSGGGVSIEQQSIVSFLNCEISANTSQSIDGNGSAGGVFCDNSSASMSDCTIAGNRVGNSSPLPSSNADGAGGGILCQNSASLTMRNCTVSQNAAADREYWGSTFDPPPGVNGGGLALRNGAQATLVNCTLRTNQAGAGAIARIGGPGGGGGGISVESAASVQLHGCVIHDNVAGHGGSGEMQGSGGLGGDGGGVFVSAGTCVISNCTLAQNETGLGANSRPRGSGGASMGPIQYSNCVIWANTPNQLAGGPSVRYSDVQGGAAGVGNISSDPQFVSIAQDNYRLAQFSPCIDAGENASVPPDSLDLDGDGDLTEPMPLDRDGNPRFQDDSGMADTGAGTPPLVDMGAYEFGLTSGCPADLNGDGTVSLADLAVLLSNFGRTGDATPADGDLSGDGSVNLADLAILLASFGESC
jgi:hypothetical protein